MKQPMIINKLLKSIVLLFIIFLYSSQSADAQDYDKSIGLRLGTYVGASFTAYTSSNKSIEVIAGLTRQANQSDYIFGGFYKYHLTISSDIPTLNWYSGLGVMLFLEEENGSNKVNIAPGGIVGLEYTLEHTPVNFFIDVNPHYKVNSNSNSKFNIHANLGVRYVISQAE